MLGQAVALVALHPAITLSCETLLAQEAPGGPFPYFRIWPFWQYGNLPYFRIWTHFFRICRKVGVSLLVQWERVMFAFIATRVRISCYDHVFCIARRSRATGNWSEAELNRLKFSDEKCSFLGWLRDQLVS